jgi:predicted GNAT superfamily acetyltransferase
MDDVINRGDRSDRFEVRWRLESDRAHRALRGEIAEPLTGPVLIEAAGDRHAPRPKETGVLPEPGAMIEVPLDYHDLRRRDPALGAEWREVSARAFHACFEARLVAASISRSGRYVFEPVDEADK